MKLALGSSSRLTSTSVRSAALLAVGVGALSRGALFAQDTIPPILAGFSFTPATINVATPANVTVNLMATDNPSGVYYIEGGFLHPMEKRCARIR
jgi:hypothetical protein